MKIKIYLNMMKQIAKKTELHHLTQNSNHTYYFNNMKKNLTKIIN